MTNSPYQPVFELTRGGTVESIHYGAVAVVDASGALLAWYGDPEAVTFMRSSAKPFQAIPFFENDGPEFFQFSLPEQAILCASHSGTDEHVATIQSLQKKAGISESQLLCGVHEPYHKPTADRLRDEKIALTPNRHNCSGKHSGMLAYIELLKQRGEKLPEAVHYIDTSHPIQVEILQTVATMCDVPVSQIGLGIDGCSAPNFAVPLYNAALAFARLCDPAAGNVEPESRQKACRNIVRAMMSSPEMVGGPARFDTRLMQVKPGKIVSKAGAEAFQGIGLLPGALGGESPAIGIALKISDGDDRKKARAAVALDVLRQIGALSDSDLGALADFGPQLTLENWRKIVVGHAYPTFRLVQPVESAIKQP